VLTGKAVNEAVILLYYTCAELIGDRTYIILISVTYYFDKVL